MKLWTYSEIESKVRKDLDMQDEDNFVGNDEMAGYCNEAIDVAEAEILKIHEDYFLTSVGVTLVQGQSDYNLPSDIYAQKIRSFIYANGPRMYEIKRVRDPRAFLEKAWSDYTPSGEAEYSYLIKSPTAGAQDKIVLVPPAQEAGAVTELWYIRNARRIPLSTDSGESRSTQLAAVIDIPEWYNFITEYMKMRCKEKERDPLLDSYKKNVQVLKDNLVSTLSNRVPDNDDTVPMDMSFYQEHS